MLAKATLAIVLSAASLPALAAQCEATIEGNDAMQFNLKEMVVDKSCKQFTVTLKHVGKMPKVAMGHNWVLTKEADRQGVATDGMNAGAAQDYVKQGDSRVIAHTKVIGGGESDSVTFDVSKLTAGEAYAFFCSFPGHWAVMKGTLKLSN
ncbi:azurin [Achromobacter sp. HZ01]|uniref:Azurin n=1 Tax=Achromobacter pulmonis TaxID=1389932 RepID=A0A2N8KLX9_9BURK|nr:MULTISPECIES: azurin [Achromobacter]PND34453.1 azurin [Achromobacter pulmonis]RAP64463.1 azurin [Achromobacter sp. HZ01]